jgi:hypothetical protein
VAQIIVVPNARVERHFTWTLIIRSNAILSAPARSDLDFVPKGGAFYQDNTSLQPRSLRQRLQGFVRMNFILTPIIAMVLKMVGKRL